jgi:predicted TPR repeat methyltransferase
VSETFDAEAHAEAMARAMDLTIEPEWKATVIANVKATAAAAELVLAFPLEDHTEPAPVFIP